MLDAKEIGNRLLRLRGKIPREVVAKEVGISVSAIGMYENGERIPRDDIKIRISNSIREVYKKFFLTGNVTFSVKKWLSFPNRRWEVREDGCNRGRKNKSP